MSQEQVVAKCLTDLAEKIGKGEIKVTEVVFETAPVKIPNDDLGIYEYHDTGFRSFTLRWKEDPK